MKSKMNKYFPTIIIATLLFSIVFIGCEDSLTANDIDNVDIPSKNVSYNQYIQPVFNVKCATSGCHDDGTRAGEYSLTNWANANMPGIVNAGNVETSILVWKITGLNGDLMPPINSVVRPLTRNEVDGIKTWIREGAENN